MAIAVGEGRTRRRPVAAIAEPRELAERTLRRKPGGRKRAALRADAARDPDSELLERSLRSAEGMREDPRDHILAVAIVGIRARAIGDAVEEAERVAHTRLRRLAVEHQADIAIGHERGRQRALDEHQVGGRLQPLEAERRLELADAHARRPRKARIQVGVLQDRRPGAEVGHDPEVEQPEGRGLEDRTHAPEHERIHPCLDFIVQIGPVVQVEIPAEAHLVGAVGRSQAEAALARRRLRGLRNLGRRFLFLELPLALEDTERLIEGLNLLFERSRRCGGPCRLRFSRRRRSHGPLGQGGRHVDGCEEEQTNEEHRTSHDRLS